MPVKRVRGGADFVEIDDGERIIRVSEADLPPDTKEKMALAMRDLLQAGLDHRQKVKDLPAGDPHQATDPATLPEYGERMFWEGQGANKELVARSVIVESVVWDGTVYVPSLRRAE
jgi:hypothetical protein